MFRFRPAAPLPPQNSLAQIRGNRLLGYAQRYKALGGGWNVGVAEWTGP